MFIRFDLTKLQRDEAYKQHQEARSQSTESSSPSTRPHQQVQPGRNGTHRQRILGYHLQRDVGFEWRCQAVIGNRPLPRQTRLLYFKACMCKQTERDVLEALRL